MQRLAVIAKLKPDAEERATELIKEGPPFDPQGTGFQRHSVYLASDEVVFVFEGGLLNALLQSVLQAPQTSARFHGGSRFWMACPALRVRRTSGSAATNQPAGANSSHSPAALPGADRQTSERGKEQESEDRGRASPIGAFLRRALGGMRRASGACGVLHD